MLMLSDNMWLKSVKQGLSIIPILLLQFYYYFELWLWRKSHPHWLTALHNLRESLNCWGMLLVVRGILVLPTAFPLGKHLVMSHSVEKSTTCVKVLFT